MKNLQFVNFCWELNNSFFFFFVTGNHTGLKTKKYIMKEKGEDIIMI